MDPVVLLAVAGLFAVINGVNDGGALLSMGLRLPTVRPITAALLLLAGVTLVPVLLGTRVATTLATRLVDFEGALGQSTLLVALGATIAVVTILTRLGLPTSLSLALIGAIVGSGAGAGLPVDWGTVGFVLLLGVLAPIVGGIGGYLLTRVPGRLPSDTTLTRLTNHLHRLGFGLQCVAYGANDGQKMLAVFAVAAGATGGAVDAAPLHLALIGGCFAVGLVIGLPRIAGTLTGKVMAVRPSGAVSAELASAATVLGSAGLGAPVSMTQAITGALVGSGLSQSHLRVRWRHVARVGAAWVFTLPSAALVSAPVTLALRQL